MPYKFVVIGKQLRYYIKKFKNKAISYKNIFELTKLNKN